jgi:hypothetical protein
VSTRLEGVIQKRARSPLKADFWPVWLLSVLTAELPLWGRVRWTPIPVSAVHLKRRQPAERKLFVRPNQDPFVNRKAVSVLLRCCVSKKKTQPLGTTEQA